MSTHKKDALNLPLSHATTLSAALCEFLSICCGLDVCEMVFDDVWWSVSFLRVRSSLELLGFLRAEWDVIHFKKNDQTMISGTKGSFSRVTDWIQQLTYSVCLFAFLFYPDPWRTNQVATLAFWTALLKKNILLKKVKFGKGYRLV